MSQFNANAASTSKLIIITPELLIRWSKKSKFRQLLPEITADIRSNVQKYYKRCCGSKAPSIDVSVAWNNIKLQLIGLDENVKEALKHLLRVDCIAVNYLDKDQKKQRVFI